MTRKAKPTQPNLADRIVAYLNPEAGARRYKARMFMDIAQSYTGASKTRAFGRSWKTSKGDADADTLYDLPEVRRRSRDSMRNNPIALGAVNSIITNAVGPGLRMQSKPDAEFLGMSEQQAQEWERQTNREFNLWAESPNCVFDRVGNFYSSQGLGFRSVLENGDCFANLPFDNIPGFPYDLRVQLIEADRISNPLMKADGDFVSHGSKNKLFGGIEKDSFGRAVAYHISDEHPGAIRRTNQLKWSRFEAYGSKTGRRNILHLYEPLRIGQSRDVPLIAPVIEPLKQLGRYTEAELTAAVVSGLFTVFVENTSGEDTDLGITEGTSSSKSKDNEIEMGSGTIIDMEPSASVKFADPSRPNTAFDPFVTSIIRQIGSGLGLPFEVLIKHYTSSYSAARAAMLDAWRFYLIRRSWLVSVYCQPVYEEWLTEAVASGRISAPGFLDGDPAIKKAYCRAMWIGPGKGQIQPLHETKAAVERIESGLSSRSKEVLELDGTEWEMIHSQSVREHQKRVEDGLISSLEKSDGSEEELENVDEGKNSDD